MQDNWTEAELDDLVTRLGPAPDDAPRSRASVEAVASRALELWLARASGQVAEDAALLEALFTSAMPRNENWSNGRAALSRLSALAQRTEAAEKERDEARENALGCAQGLLDVAEVLTNNTKEPAINAARRVVKERDMMRHLLDSTISQRETLKGERDALRAEVDRLQSRNAMWEVRIAERNEALEVALLRAEAAESRLAAVRERAKDTAEIRRRFAEALQSFCTHDAAALVIAEWVWAADGLGDAPNPSIPSKGSGDAPKRCKVCGEPKGKPHKMSCYPENRKAVERSPCSEHCTHPDALKNGHPARAKEQSEVVRPKEAYEDGARPMAGNGERVRALSERILPGPDVIDGGPGSRGPVRRVAKSARHQADSHAEGAEAMREACWEAVKKELRETGWDSGTLAKHLKAAIKGAKP